MADDVVREIKRRLSIVDIIGRRVSLRRRGQDYLGLCPFHKEKTPSFHVSTQRSLYYCFGCHAGGDLVNFIQRIDRTDFRGALEFLAREAGVSLPVKGIGDSAAQQSVRQRLTALLEAVQMRFMDEYTKHSQAQDHVKERGISEEMRSAFGLGWCPEPEVFMRWVSEEKWSEIDLIALGLIIERSSGSQLPYVRFQRRLTIPIRSAANHMKAFGGRALDSRPARYINSPESTLFAKRENLFHGASFRQSVASRQRVVVVEGYFDVIALTQAGCLEVCSALGTAIGEHQLASLWQMNIAPIICFDGDSAGQAAMRRLLERALPQLSSDRQLRFVYLPASHDPDSFVREYGLASFDRLLDSATPASQALVRWMEPPSPHAEREQQVTYLAGLRRSIDQIKDSTYRQALMADWRDEQQRLFYNRSRGPRATSAGGAYVGTAGSNKSVESSRLRSPAKNLAKAAGPDLPLTSQRALLNCLLNEPELIEKHCEFLVRLTLLAPYDSLLRAMLEVIPSMRTQQVLDKDYLVGKLSDRYGKELQEIGDRKLSVFSSASQSDAASYVESVTNSLQKKNQEQELKSLARQLGESDSLQNSDQLSKKMEWLNREMN